MPPLRTRTWGIGAAVFLVGASAHAAQFVAADVTYTHSAQTTTDSHYRVSPSAETPANWTSPVAYSTGSAHVRLEVRTKPNTTTETTFQVCFEATLNYGCTDISKPYTTTGVYEWDTPFARFFTPGPVPWERGVLKVAILLKDTHNVKPAPENVGAATSALYMPTDVHVTVTVVSSGSTFQPPAGTSPVDAGGTNVTPRDAAATDSSPGTGSTPPTGGDDAAPSSPDSKGPTAVEDAGPIQPPPVSTGQGGNQGTNPSPASRDAAAVDPKPPSAGQAGSSGSVGNPAVGSGVSGSGCSLAGRDIRANLGGLAFVFALVMRWRRRELPPRRGKYP